MGVYFTITNNCNLECAHCYACSGPGKESMSPEDIKKVIDNLPRSIEDLTISGGEAFTRKKLLYNTLEQIKLSGIKIKELAVQTNAFWAKDKKTARETLEELAEKFGASVNSKTARTIRTEIYSRLACHNLFGRLTDI